MPKEQKRTRPEKEIDLTLNEIHLLAQWISDHQNDPIWHNMVISLRDRFLSVWLYWSDKTNDPGSFTLRLRRQ